MPTILKWTYDGGDAGEDAAAEMQAKAQGAAAWYNPANPRW